MSASPVTVVRCPPLPGWARCNLLGFEALKGAPRAATRMRGQKRAGDDRDRCEVSRSITAE